MKITDSIQLQLIKEATSDKESLCEVICSHQPTGIYIRGKVFEQAIWVEAKRYLIFTTDDVIFEESLNLYFIELGKGILDRLWIAQPYNTDTFNGVTILDDTSLSFSFLYLRDWKLTIYRQPRLRFSILSWLYFFQGFRLFRYLTLRFMPK